MFSIHRNHLSYQGVDYVTFGQGDKVLVIITGLSLQGLSDMSDLAIYSLFYRFAKEYKVYIFDRKDHIEEGISIENMADDLYHSLQELHIANASIIGMSQGGMIAQLFAIKYPQKVKKLVLALTLSRNNAVSRETIGGWIEMTENNDMDQLNKDSMSKSFSSPVLKKLYVINRLFLKSVSKEKRNRFVCLAKSILEFDCHKSLDKITCPTLVLGAKKDLVLGVVGARELANSIPKASYYEFSKQGHAAFIESKQFNKMILEFLRKNA
ncbi:alpha/beta fold hydrolase [Streptococcus salivarius]|uniref:alpha/beta fold hydrolase n=1 Tax=Streptococcus salivarius TaxID=1304 RepID=UPI00321AA2E0